MPSDSAISWPLILTSLILALLVSIIPWPAPIAWCQPEWVLLLLIYWSTTFPEHVGIGTAWCVGLLQDSLSGAVLGEHALVAALVVYFAISLHLRFRLYPIWQQAFCVMLMVLLAKVGVFWIEGILGRSPVMWQYWLPVLSSFLLWPVLRYILENVSLLPNDLKR